MGTSVHMERLPIGPHQPCNLTNPKTPQLYLLFSHDIPEDAVMILNIQVLLVLSPYL